jgi:predicted secreted protein
MVHKYRRRIALMSMLLFALGSVYAGDVAQFVNLGFSPDSSVFMFAQHGVHQETSRPFAEIYTVDVPANSFIPSGVVRHQYDVQISPGQDGIGALFTLLPEVRETVQRYRVNHLRQGRPLYVLVNGRRPKSHIEFRDFETENRYTITLTQTARGEGTDGSAAFHLDVSVHFPDGDIIERRVGRPNLYRPGVNRYRLQQVILASDQRSLVMVVERVRDTSSGERIRYMIETVRLP